MQDWKLLRQYVDNGSDAAFGQLAQRYTNLVYATCRREVGDAHLAEDVTQAVFLLLARKARTFRRGTILAGWLFQTALLASRNARQSERRRQVREQKAAELMDDVQHGGDHAAWDEIEPHFNAALLTLKPRDREAILLRLGDDLSLRETGEALSLSEDAARKRVTRAIEKMRGYLVKHGITISAVGVGTFISTRAASAAPTTCVARIAEFSSQTLSHGAAAAASAKAVTITQGVLKSMSLTTLKITAAATCGLVLAGGMVYQGMAGAGRLGAGRAVYKGVARTTPGPGTGAKARLASVQPAQVASSVHPSVPLPTGIPGTEAEALKLLIKMQRVYSTAKTCSFTETTEGESRFGMPYTMRYTFERPDKFEIRMTRDGKTSRLLYQDSEILTIPVDDPGKYQAQDVRWHREPWTDGLLIATGVLGLGTGQAPASLHADFAEFEKEMNDPNMRKWVSILMGKPSILDGTPVDTVIDRFTWSRTPDVVLTIEYAIGQDDHVVHRETYRGADSKGLPMNFTAAYSDIQIDKPIPAEMFIFMPPPGTPVPKPAPASTIGAVPPDVRARVEAMIRGRESNFTAREFNGSKRTSLPDDQVSAEARQLGGDYIHLIYPALLKAVRKSGELPGSLQFMPELETYMKTHPNWVVPQTFRIDGTLICRPLYVNNPPDGPHDPWTSIGTFTTGGASPGSPNKMYRVYGWDDGKVTFTLMDDDYQTDFTGGPTASSPPGAAGIPPGTLQFKQAVPR